MADIYIYYQLNTQKYAWLETDTQGLISRQQSNDELTTIAPFTTQAKVHVIIAATLLYSTTIQIPGKNYNQIVKAIPFAIEEELSEDVEKLHFALSTIIKNKPVTVVTITKTLLENILGEFSAAGITIHELIPECFALPYAENTWQMKFHNDNLIIRISNFSGLSINQNLIKQILPQVLAKNKPEKIIYHGNENIADLETTSQEVGIEFIQLTTPSILLELAAKSLTELPYINLLQGVYKPKHKTNKTTLVWYLAAATASVWIILLLVGTLFSYFYYNYKTTALNAQIEQVYKQVFPNATAIVDPKIRMQREIQRYQGANNDAGFLFLLAKVGSILKQMPDINLQNISYQNDSLSISVKTKDFQNLQSFSRNLATTGLVIKQTNAATNNNFVTAEYSLAKGAAQ